MGVTIDLLGSLLKTIQKILFNMYSYICLLTKFNIFNQLTDMNLISAMFLCLIFFLSSLKKKGVSLGSFPFFSGCFFFIFLGKRGKV